MGESLVTAPPTWERRDCGGFVLHADPAREAPLAFARSVAAGLDDEPRWLDARYLYDAAGSELFECITEQPEYYQTRTEDRLLERNARTIREIAGAVPLVELGSGSSSKTRRLLDAWTAVAPAATHYTPIDVSEVALAQACAELCRGYGGLAVEGVAASYERALPVLRHGSPMILAFLGSSLGNLGRQEEDEFLELVAAHLRTGDFFLVGLDLVKDPGTLEAAYNDAAGVTAAFTKNLFRRMNRELGTDIPLDAVEHVAFYNQLRERIEIYAEFTRDVTVRLPTLGRAFHIARGERIRTELSQKYRPEAAAARIERHGFRLSWSDADPKRWFGLLLLERTGTRRVFVPGRTAGERPGTAPAHVTSNPVEIAGSRPARQR